MSHFDLAPDTIPKKSWPERVDPHRVRILEQGKFEPLVWNKSDVKAAETCQFSIERAFHFRDIIHSYFTLWQGEYNGQVARLEDDWQWPCLSRIMGWVTMSKRWGRWIRRFKDADVWVGKKNKKSPTAAFVGIYLWAFDGEPGSQILTVAKDGKQGMRVHEHVLNMVRASKLFTPDQVKINKGTGELLHIPTLSKYSLLHGDNIESQEGLNGSYVMDEVHVVPINLAQVLKGMGASRAEALNFRVSTAGADPESYGRRRYDFGKKVAAGEVSSITTFFKAYEAPQNASDDELLTNEELWKMANPCWNRTIDPEELRREIEEAKDSSVEWSNIKRRRLGIWQVADNPWLVGSDWLACGSKFNRLDFANHMAVAGGDFSKTRDLTSLALVWDRTKIDEKIYVWCHFWVPESRVVKLRDRVPFEDWAKAGWVTITKGRVLNETVIKNEIGQIFKEQKIGVFNYDPLFASNIVSKLQADGVTCNFNEFKQTLFHFTPGTIRTDKLILERGLIHHSNPCLTWQFLHARLKEREGYCKPIKPESSDNYQSVDGVQSVIMAIDGLKLIEQEMDYDDMDLVVLGTDGSLDRF